MHGEELRKKCMSEATLAQLYERVDRLDTERENAKEAVRHLKLAKKTKLQYLQCVKPTEEEEEVKKEIKSLKRELSKEELRIDSAGMELITLLECINERRSWGR